MASFLNIISTFEDYEFTSSLDTFSLTTASDAAVTITVYVGGYTAHKQKYWTYDRFLIVRDLRTIVESALQEHDLCSAITLIDVQTYAGIESKGFVAIHSSFAIPKGIDTRDWLYSHFLSAFAAKRLGPESEDRAYAFSDPRESEGIPQIYATASGSGGTRRLTVTPPYDYDQETGIMTIDVSAKKVQADFDHLFTSETLRLAMMTLIYGRRTMTWFVMPTEPDLTLSFHNNFNAREQMFLWGKTTVKTDTEKTLARLGDTAAYFDQINSQTFVFESSDLTSHEAQGCDQLVASPRVMFIPPGATTYKDILITEHTCEMHDSDEHPNTLKLTWRYSDARPILPLGPSVRRFTEHFNPTFY